MDILVWKVEKKVSWGGQFFKIDPPWHTSSLEWIWEKLTLCIDGNHLGTNQIQETFQFLLKKDMVKQRILNLGGKESKIENF